MLRLAIGIFVGSLLLIAGLMTRAYLTRDKPIWTSEHGIQVYSESPVEVNRAQFDMIVERYIVHMTRFFDDSALREHMTKVTCRFTAGQIEVYGTPRNGVAWNAGSVEVYLLSADLERTALEYEIHNTVLLAFCGYEVAIDEGGAKRAKYDDWFNGMDRR